MEDYFGNVPDIVIDKILGKLPIRMAAQTSVLSKQWRRAWLSLSILVFDYGFWRGSDSRKCSEIISNILFYHNGPVHDFRLFIPSSNEPIKHNSWISFLSKNGARKIEMRNWFTKMDIITSNIFLCSELVQLKLTGFGLNPPPTDFSVFPNLKYLVLQNIVFHKQNFVSSLIEQCRKLETLKLANWRDLDHVVIDAPSLQTLLLDGYFESLAFRNIRSLKSISVRLDRMPIGIVSVERLETVDAVNLLASSCQLQSIEFNGLFCKFLSVGGVRRFTSVTFNHLDNLCLSNLNLSDFHIYRYLLSIIECCPYIKTLNISLIQGESVVGQHVLDLDFNHKYKLNHLREVNINGITGSSAELKLVEYVLAISASLENMFFKYGTCDTESKLKMSVELMRFPRASPKASLVCLER